jgi:hypothetical protein
MVDKRIKYDKLILTDHSNDKESCVLRVVYVQCAHGWEKKMGKKKKKKKCCDRV